MVTIKVKCPYYDRTKSQKKRISRICNKCKKCLLWTDEGFLDLKEKRINEQKR